ncbi:MAG: exosortase system-associated protein, TIGR04073 family [Lentisphaeraceae bacterium]|nr:exosortase system-associated protein, TIGR04073 family [Lentisphaeraceae bacterium]
MFSRKFKALVALCFIATQTVVLADSKEQEVDPGAKAIMYIPDRIADLFDAIRVGVAFGPAIGAEVAITKYGQLGAYASNEAGFAWTGRGNQKQHKGAYATAVISLDRVEHEADDAHHFHRSDYQIRAQAALGLVHGYVALDLVELGDFFAGLICMDPSKDDATYGQDQLDKDYDTIYGTTPFHRLGRGLSNVLFGALEIPNTSMAATKDQGPIAGATYGLSRGIGHFIVREVTGVWEILTFPKGGKHIIEPEYPWSPDEDVKWSYDWN